MFLLPVSIRLFLSLKYGALSQNYMDDLRTRQTLLYLQTPLNLYPLIRDRVDQAVRLLLQEALTGVFGLLSRYCLRITFANQDIRLPPIPTSASQR
jgi:hypothetical protein